MVSNYFQDCKYLVNKLQPYVYLISEDALKDIKIDNGDAYISSINETPTRLDVYNISLTEGDELNERFKFTHTLTFSVNGYANKDDFNGKYYVILKDDDGTYWLINPLFPCKITYTYTLAYEENHTDFNIGTISNHPVLRLLGMTDSQPYECKKYFISGIDALWLNEKRYTAHDGDAVKYTNGGFKAIEYNKKSAVFTEEFDGTKVSHTIDFNVLFSDYKSSWHYNLLEFKDNLYAGVIKTTDGKYALCGFGFGMQPSFTVNADDSETINYIEIKLQDAHDVGDVIYFYDDITYEYLSGKTWEYTSEYNGYECLSAGTAVYLLKKEVDALENETGRFMVRQGHRSEFPELDLVEEEFDDDVEFENMDCGSQACIIQTGLPSTINFNSVGCKQYYLKADSDWTITSSSSSISVSPSSGDAETPYTISVCNNIVPSSAAVTSNLTLSYCSTTSIINVIVSEDEDSCLPQGSTYNISANEQTLTIPTKCCVTSVKDSLNIGVNITVYESYISAIVPQNNTGVNRTITLLVLYCDGTSGSITINQSNVFERWDDDSTFCVEYDKYKRQYKYTGTTSSSITARTDEYRDVLVQTKSRDCGYVEPIYRWFDLDEYICSGTTKYHKSKKQVSYNNGSTWEDVIPIEYGTGTKWEEQSEDCGYIPPQYRYISGSPYCISYDKYIDVTTEVSYDSGVTWEYVSTTPTLSEVDSTFCGVSYRWQPSGTTCVGYDKWEQSVKQKSYDGVSWVNVTPLTTSATTLIEADSEDCGYVPPTPQYRWVKTDNEICIKSSGYLTFKAIDTISIGMDDLSGTIYHSLDSGNTWTVGANINVNAGDTVMWKATLTPTDQIPYGIGKFAVTGKFDVEGNPMSLLFGDDFDTKTDLTNKKHAFNLLFHGCTGLTSAENFVLPATTLEESCYCNMFEGCKSLTTVPRDLLPATTLTASCYFCMFNGCTRLTAAPDLPATTLANGCYWGMFQSCVNLTTAPELPATTLADECYGGMFYNCTSLSVAPELLAETLTSYCYSNMFQRCSNLNYIKCLAINNDIQFATQYWVDGVASSGTFIKAQNATWRSGKSGIPSGWVVQNV